MIPPADCTECHGSGQFGWLFFHFKCQACKGTGKRLPFPCTRCGTIITYHPPGSWHTAEYGWFCNQCGPRSYGD